MWRWWIVVAAVVVLAGCGSEPRRSGGTADALHKDVAAARAAAGSGDRDAAVAALADLEKRVGQAESDGELSSSAADALRRGAARARRRAELEIAPSQPEATPTATATPTPTPTPTLTPEKKPPKGPKKGKGHGKDEQGDEG